MEDSRDFPNSRLVVGPAISTTVKAECLLNIMGHPQASFWILV